ncbi:Two component regulator propeller [Cnuella takakiae]|uniref:Two component regulator propeller n=1 Tax=Cnuella takakiae TaxID=1302690 RepID=A0A1M5BR82_9BACT|nr:two-component regulator propeller domain-containing protein [Cnuella takakiae]OLY93486.1 histidine kinase [Cnuella takakiae]SHF45029.1 Two component regulator propeller [Cnuella takakiae]
MKYAHLYLLLLLVNFSTSGKGQDKADLPPDTIKAVNMDVVTSYGPKTSVRGIRQDRKGNIWLASEEGIIRYDGKSFANITRDINSDRYFFVLEDRKGNHWFAAYGTGVYYYDGQSFRHYTTNQGLASNRISIIYEDKGGDIWFGVDGGVSRYDGTSFQNFPTEGGQFNNDVNAIMEDKSGKLWFGTRGHTYVYDGKSFAVFTYNGEPVKNVWSMIEDRKGNIWFGGGSGLWRFNGSTRSQFTKSFINNIYEDKKGNIWTSGYSSNSNGFGLSRYDHKALSSIKPTVTEIAQSPHFFRILEAKDGSIWYGAVDGVYRYDGNTITDFKDKVVQRQ